MTTRSVGQQAEQAAAGYLQGLGFEVIDRNWQLPKLCEIDIVAKLEAAVYFVEVKYRQSSTYGSGLEYITRSKLQHMQRAAAIWIRSHNYDGNFQISAISVTGKDYCVEQFIREIY